MLSRSRPHIAYFALGGTIASSSESGEGALIKLTAADLISALPRARELVELDYFTFREVPSGELVMSDILELAEEIRGIARTGAEGVVVTQGTDTLEETSYLLDILIEEDVPVVLTGAMRNSSLPGTDGPANLLAAVQVAASGVTTGLGAVVVFNRRRYMPPDSSARDIRVQRQLSVLLWWVRLVTFLKGSRPCSFALVDGYGYD